MNYHHRNRNWKSRKLELRKRSKFKSINEFNRIRVQWRLTSDTFNGTVSGETWWTRTRFEVIDGRAFGVHSACMRLNTWIGTLTGRAYFIQSTFLIQRASWFADARITISVRLTVG